MRETALSSASRRCGTAPRQDNDRLPVMMTARLPPSDVSVKSALFMRLAKLVHFALRGKPKWPIGAINGLNPKKVARKE